MGPVPAQPNQLVAVAGRTQGDKILGGAMDEKTYYENLGRAAERVCACFGAIDPLVLTAPGREAEAAILELRRVVSEKPGGAK